jgi:hypothetical protein
MASQSSQDSQLSSQELNNVINDTVLYILSQDHTKYAIKQQDIVRNVFKTHGKKYKYIMNEVTRVLKEVKCIFFLSMSELK